MRPEDQQLIDEDLAETRERLESWVQRELSAPLPMGAGRNNQMIQLAPRMLELGFDGEAVFEKFKEMYGLENDDSKDDEIQRVIERAHKYVTEIVPKDPEETAREKAEAAQTARMAAAALNTVMTKYAWPEADIIDIGGCKGLTPNEQRTRFLSTMFECDDVVWCGQVHHSGHARHARNFRTALEWCNVPAPSYEFLSHCTFKPGSFSRCSETVCARRYLIVESDELSRDQIGAVFNWLVVGGLQLRAVVYSGGRSLHGWFNWRDDIDDMGPNLVGLRCDPSVLRPSQPVRMPGIMRRDTQQIQRLLYLST